MKVRIVKLRVAVGAVASVAYDVRQVVAHERNRTEWGKDYGIVVFWIYHTPDDNQKYGKYDWKEDVEQGT